MVQKTLFKKIQDLHDKLLQNIKEANTQYDNWIGICEASLMKVDESVRILKSLIVDNQFQSIADEVHFFKDWKPLFISKFIYYSKILSIESYRPEAGDKVLRKYYENEQEKLKSFYRDNADFYSYYRRNATYLDHKYFVRNSYDMKMKLSFSFYNFDSGFTTSHDQYIAHIIANNRIEEYLRDEMDKIGNAVSEKSTFISPLSWSSSKVSLIELIYGLHLMRCFNGGNIELSEITRTFEKMLGVDLSNFHKILGEIRLRKTGRTKFLHLLEENLEQHFTDLDG